MTARVALVTGAARGQGWAITQRLRADGFSVAACDVNAAELRAAVEDDLRQLGLERVPVVNLRRMDLGPGVQAEGDQIVDLDDQLAEMIARVARSRERHKHPATRVFQALRIHVNAELDELESALRAALDRLAPRGRLAVISFHSLEDRLVKRFMKRESEVDPALVDLPVVPPELEPRLKLVGKKARAAEVEVDSNPRSRSALLRVAEKVR